jgi:hypothetical protein
VPKNKEIMFLPFLVAGYVQQGRRKFVRAGGAVPIEAMRAVLLLPTCRSRDEILLSALRTSLPRTPQIPGVAQNNSRLTLRS